MTFRKTLSAILLSAFLSACGGGSGDTNTSTPVNNTPAPDGAQVAQDYLTEVLTIMQENALTRYDVNWGNLEAEVNALAADAQSIVETYPALNKAFELLGTNHSYIRDNGVKVSGYSDIDCTEPLQMPAPKPELSDIGYIRVDSYSSGTGTSDINFASSIQNHIAQQDSDTIVGWIVDLRNNGGGNMFPMIAGLGPLLNEGPLGYFITADEEITPWGYESGKAFSGDNEVVTIEAPYELIKQFPKVAVLSSRRVASSGEASLISFKKQDNARLFGTDSCGLSTANSGFELSNGSRLILTTAIMADRELQRYGGQVAVDEVVAQDQVLQHAIDWIRE